MMFLFSKFLCGVLFLSMTLISCLFAQVGDRDSSMVDMSPEVYNKVAPVTVRITNDEDKPGSGVIIGIDTSSLGNVALILTACHVVVSNFEDALADLKITPEFYKDIQVFIWRDTSSLIAIVDTGLIDLALDIAIIKAHVPDSIDQVIKYNEEIYPPQTVAAFGYPHTEDVNQTVGKVIREEGKFYVFDAKIEGGNSGGPLVDDEGNMVGMNILKVGEEKEGYATNVKLLVAVVNNWLKEEPAVKFWESGVDTFWEKMYKNPWFIAVEAIVVGGIIYYFCSRSDGEDKTFGSPPNPP